MTHAKPLCDVLFPPLTAAVYDLPVVVSGMGTCCSTTCWVILVTVTAGVDAGVSDVVW